MQIYKSKQSVNMIRPDSNVLDAVTYYALEYFSLGSNWRSIEVTEGRSRPHGSSERGQGNIHGFVLPTRIDYYSNPYYVHRIRCEDKNVAFTHVQPHYYHVGQLGPCHQSG